MYVAWKSENEIYIAKQRALPFGSIRAVYGWHRFANLYGAIARILMLIPVAKFVDDIFGTDKA